MTVQGKRPVGRPASGGEDKRARILSEAVAVFAGEGYEGASLATIADRSGITKAGVLHHFGSKEGLFEAVLDHRNEADSQRWGHSETPWAFLDDWIALAQENARRPGIVSLHTSLLASAGNPQHPANGWLRGHFEHTVQYIVDGFEQAKQRGYVQPEAPSIDLARSLTALSDGLQAQWLIEHTTHNTEATSDPGIIPFDLPASLAVFVNMIKERWSVPTITLPGEQEPSSPQQWVHHACSRPPRAR